MEMLSATEAAHKADFPGSLFNQNCGDLRNCKLVYIINELKTCGVEVFVNGPQAEADERMHEYGVRLLNFEDLQRADAIVAAASYGVSKALSIEDIGAKVLTGCSFIDVKASFDLPLFRKVSLCI